MQRMLDQMSERDMDGNGRAQQRTNARGERAVSERDDYTPPSPEVFRPQPGRFFQPTMFGFSRLAVQLGAIFLGFLTLLLAATLVVADLRTDAIDSVTQSLLVQSDATVEALSRTGDEPALFTVSVLETADPVGTARPRPAGSTVTDMTADVRRIVSRVLEGSPTKARIFSISNERLLDSSQILQPGAPSTEPSAVGIVEAIWNAVASLQGTGGLSEEPAETEGGGALDEVNAAITGAKSTATRIDPSGDILVSVASPIRSDDGSILAVLHLRSAPGAVIAQARASELAIIQVFSIAALISVFVALAMAGTITRPIRSLARAADRIRAGGITAPMPEFADRGEIGELSRVLHDMTVALYSRIDSIEAFAGEVAHELKNPLTSLRSAVETLPLARTDKSREQLLEIIQHDVRRIDRLISDISDASKLDAELNRHRYERLDLIDLLQAVVETQADIATDRNQSVELVVRGNASPQDFQVVGNDGRLSQVFTNLIDNARSFTPDDQRVVVTAQRFQSFIEVVVDDEGPGIDEDSLEKIFLRFYTDRSDQSQFGNNSGLGLAISRQIIEAHGGEIFAENRYRTTLGPDRDVAGARLTVRLPAEI